ncbi:MAG: DUF5591 domain-containing protein, partial [Candidatus Heimdallarchaeaceae archaeon]
FFSFLVYSGIDFFDNSISYFISKNGYFLTHNSIFPIDKHPQCYCPYCVGDSPDLFNHNNLILQNSLSQIRFSLREGTLRTLVEQNIHSSVTFAATLRYFDKTFSSDFRIRTPIILNSSVKCVGEESLHRPVIVEYRERVKERFSPKKTARLVILLPCSAKKPYSFSRSHMLFKKAIREQSKGFHAFLSELIITSPLSVVPRELESIFPTKFYDIPVSGEWSSEEVELTADLLLEILEKYPEDTKIINHTHGKGYDDIVKIIEDTKDFEVFSTSNTSSPTSNSSLIQLKETIKQALTSFDSLPKSKDSPLLNQLRATADYQFGLGTGKVLFPQNTKIRGKYPQNRQIFVSGELVATLLTSNGFLSLQPISAQKIADLTQNIIEFGAEKITGSTIFAPGCIRANEEIHPNDEVIVKYHDKVLATAIALVSGKDMNKMTSGQVAIVKKKVKVKK